MTRAGDPVGVRWTEGFPLFEFSGLRREPRVVHGVSGRGEGLDASSDSAGSPAASAARARVLRALGLAPSRIVSGRQVHGATIETVGTRGAPPAGGVDGWASAEAGVALAVTTADCPAVFVFDPRTPALALVHAGWRGTLAGIARAAVDRLARDFGSDRSLLRVGVGPGIGPCCYEVGEDLLDRLPGSARERHVRARGARWSLDLPGWIETELREAGVPPERMERAALCTACRVDLFHSHRAERGRAGRGLALAAIR